MTRELQSPPTSLGRELTDTELTQYAGGAQYAAVVILDENGNITIRTCTPVEVL